MLSRSRTISSWERPPTFPPPPTPRTKPTRVARSRSFILPTILMFAFTTLILAVIYSYCVATKYNQSSDALLRSNSSASADTSLDSSTFSKRSNASGDAAGYLPSSPTSSNSNATSAGTSYSERGFSLKDTAVLGFYSTTLPFLSMAHLSVELFLNVLKPGMLASRTAHLIVFTTTMSLAAGWITTTAFWLHCELPGRGNQGICPVQVRGHFMYGIHELSIAKSAIASVIVLLYLIHAGTVLGSMKGNRRAWAVAGEGDGHGQAKEMFVILEEGKNKEQVESRVRFARLGP